MAAQTSFLATIWTLFGLALVATAARVVVRLHIQRKFQAEDYFAVLAALLLTGLTTVVTAMVPLFGMEQEYLEELPVNPEAVPPFSLEVMEDRTVLALKLLFSQMLLFWSAIWASKISLLLFFRQFEVDLPKYTLVWWAILLLILVSYVGCMVSNFLTCIPFSNFWNLDAQILIAYIGLISVSGLPAHWIFAILPIRIICTLRISVIQKLAILCLFSFSMVVVVLAFVRLYSVTKATTGNAIDGTKLTDVALILSFWSQIEAAVFVIVASLPAIRSHLWRQFGESITEIKESKGSNKLCKVRHLENSDPEARSKAAFSRQSAELAGLSVIDEEEWPITGKAAEMLGVIDRTQVSQRIEPGDDEILATIEVKVTRSPRQDYHTRADSGENAFELQLRPDLA